MKMMSNNVMARICACSVVLLFLSLFGIFPDAVAQDKVPPVKDEKTANSALLKSNSATLLESIKKEKSKSLEENEGIENKVKQNREEVLRLKNEGFGGDMKLFALGNASKLIQVLFFPVGNWFFLFLGKTVEIFFFITIINLFLYIIYREGELFNKHKRVIVISFVILLFLAFPAYGEETTPKELTSINKPDPFINLLNMANEQIQWDVLKRYITILKAKKSNAFVTVGKHGRSFPGVILPEIKIDNAHLRPWQSIAFGQPEYYFSLAALYLQNGEQGKAEEELKNIFELSPNVFALQEEKYNEMLEKVIGFFLEKNMIQATAEAAKKSEKIINDVPTLIRLSDVLYKNKMQESAGDLLKKATRIASLVKNKLELADFTLQLGRKEEAEHIVAESFNSTENLDDIISILEFAFAKNLPSTIKPGIEKGQKFSRSVSGHKKLADFLIKKDRKQEASQTIINGYKSTSDPVGILDIARFAIENKFYDEAGKAINNLMNNLGMGSLDYFVDAPRILPTEEFLPGEEKITLPVYYGAIKQAGGALDDALDSYKDAINHELKKGLENFEITGNLNNFFFLKQLLVQKADQPSLKILAPVYEKVEKDYLEKLKMEHGLWMAEMGKALATSKNSLEESENEIKRIKSEQTSKKFQVAFQFCRVVAFSILGIFVLVGIVAKSYREAKAVSRFEVYTFVWKFFETSGLFYFLTIIGIPIGIVLVFVGQFFGNISRMQQDTERQSGVMDNKISTEPVS